MYHLHDIVYVYQIIDNFILLLAKHYQYCTLNVLELPILHCGLG